ncbi:hob3 [Candida theae]|uniref:Hob3 n=1 Tax=Candida theae TaxID=1198502 RepID=A0AAD5FWN0_9ASCO|nr:hob3 [Candida theae]KAI5949774.1 hob3 [Candida theae]
MSWLGLKKAINRAGTQVMLKAGQIDQTVDTEFEYEEKRFRVMESNSIALQKKLRTYLESLKMLTKSQLNIAELLDSFYGQESSMPHHFENSLTGAELDLFKNLSGEYFHDLKQLNTQVINDLEHPYNQTVLNPIARFNSYYVEVNDAIKKRHHKLLDYDAMRNKVKKLIDTPQTEYSDYESRFKELSDELVDTESKYVDINEKLKDELPKLVNMRIAFFDPSFESFVKIQLRFFNENYQTLHKLQSKMDAQTKQDYAEGKLDDKIDHVLSKMRALDITGKDSAI